MRAFILILALPGLLFLQCRTKEKNAGIPDVQTLYDNINYLDSLLTSPRVDSIEEMELHLVSALDNYKDNLQTPDSRVIYDSLQRISAVASQFTRFCTDSRSNLELLRRDISASEEQYRGGKIKADYLISALLESEQIQVDINNRYLNESKEVWDALLISQKLELMLSSFNDPLSVPAP